MNFRIRAKVAIGTLIASVGGACARRFLADMVRAGFLEWSLRQAFEGQQPAGRGWSVLRLRRRACQVFPKVFTHLSQDLGIEALEGATVDQRQRAEFADRWHPLTAFDLADRIVADTGKMTAIGLVRAAGCRATFRSQLNSSNIVVWLTRLMIP